MPENANEKTVEIATTNEQAHHIADVLLAEAIRLKNVKSLPRGMTPGDVMARIEACANVSRAISYALTTVDSEEPSAPSELSRFRGADHAA